MVSYKFSIIIPVYNVGKAFERCLLSIVSQTYKNYEVIIIDDGSTDRDTISICEKYATNYDHIRCVHKENTGCLDSRITGAKLAKGEFCTYCDSDDYVSEDYFEQMDKIVRHKSDLYVLNNYLYEVKSGQCRPEYHGFNDGSTDILEIKKKIISMQMGAVWNKIYKTALLKKAVEGISLRMNLCDDSYINMMYLTEISTVYISTKAIYYHVVDSESSVCANDISTYRLREIDELFKVQEQVKNKLSVFSEYNKFMDSICGLFFRTVAKLVQQGEDYSRLSSEMDNTEVYHALTHWTPRNVKLGVYNILIKNKSFNVMKVLTIIRGKKWRY